LPVEVERNRLGRVFEGHGRNAYLCVCGNVFLCFCDIVIDEVTKTQVFGCGDACGVDGCLDAPAFRYFDDELILRSQNGIGAELRAKGETPHSLDLFGRVIDQHSVDVAGWRVLVGCFYGVLFEVANEGVGTVVEALIYGGFGVVSRSLNSALELQRIVCADGAQDLAGSVPQGLVPGLMKGGAWRGDAKHVTRRNHNACGLPERRRCG